MSLKLLKEHSSDNLGIGVSEEQINQLEESLDIQLPQEYKDFLVEIGYAEIYGDEIYSIYEIPDTETCKGIHWTNTHNELLSDGFIEFFSNDIDGTFYIESNTGKVFLNDKDSEYAKSFYEFLELIINE
ncbi:SMI1/KNR4 family protein [Marinifilum flexuosum]|uniref:SMI1/KNR4 family protein n=1 Tax=Marinifilum flexuosum TaxID=1117708 RepID=UPI002494C108|nr:SMI1/KNR4 family protein [Marinifilum flexuosum]